MQVESQDDGCKEIVPEPETDRGSEHERNASVMSHKYDCISGLLLVGCRLCQQLYRLK